MSKLMSMFSHKKLIVFLLLVLSLVLAGIFFIPFAVRYVIQCDDVNVGLMGSVPERSIHASDLYPQGIAARIILVEDDREKIQRVYMSEPNGGVCGV